MFYETHKTDIVRLMGGNLGMLPRFQIFEARLIQAVDDKDEPSAKRMRKNELKNERNFTVDGKLEQKSTGF